MKLLLENWRSYLKEGMKRAEDIGHAVVEDERHRIIIKIYNSRVDDRPQKIGQIYCMLLDDDNPEWDEEDRIEDQSIECYNDVWVVGNVNAKQGFGPLLYDMALEYIYDERGGVMMSGGHGESTGDVKEAAAKVWQYYFKNRSDVYKVKDHRCSDILSPWILKNPQLKPYLEALMHVYYKDKDILYDLEDEEKIEYR